MPKIYTKTGDSGETCLIGGRKTPKDDIRLEACGTVDELNSILGLVRSEKSEPLVNKQIHRIQGELLNVGAEIASPLTSPPRITSDHTRRLEGEIDTVERELPPLRQFILPGGGRVGSLLHLARSVCRRAERRVTALAQPGAGHPEMMIYLNRLSDWLFVMARYSTRAGGGSDILWNGFTEEE